MLKIAFLCPYFGILPNHFQLWLNTCNYNSQINWIIITDDRREFIYPKNVKVIYKSFEELRLEIQDKFDFKISLETPYKLCDYKPAYGYIFSDILNNYDFWGHCDLDVIFGDIRKFITDDILKKYDKILCLGHMTLYRNIDKINKRFMLPLNNKSYMEIFSSSEHYGFDEFNRGISINKIYREYDFPMYINNIYCDISPLYYNFRLSKLDDTFSYCLEKDYKQIFLWEKGKLYRIYRLNKNIKKEEYAYVHFQKRKMDLMIDNIKECSKFIIVPNKFIPISINKNIGADIINKYSKRKLFYRNYYVLKYKALKWHIKNLVKILIRRK